MKRKSLFLLCVMAMMCVGFSAQAAKTTTSKTIDVKAFTSIISNAVANIIFTQGNTTSVVVKGNQDAVNRTKVEVKNGQLQINTTGNDKNNQNSSDVVIYVTAPNISDVNMSGVGSFKINGDYKGDDLKMNINGVSNVDAKKLDVKNITVNGNGVGNVNLGGKAQTANLGNNGVGNIDAKNLKVQDVKANNNGIGDINCHAEKSIDTKNSAVGNVNYYGQPSNTKVSNNGMGTVNRKK